MESSSTAVIVVRSTPPKEAEDGDGLKKEELSQDDIGEIFARLPVKSLLRFRSLSKFWYSLILSPNFIALHSSHSHRKNQVSLLSYSSKKNVTRRNPNAIAKPPTTTFSFGIGHVTEKLTFSGQEGRVEIVGCFNGVVCLSLSEYPQQKYALWNPATRQVKEIGDAPMVGPRRWDLTNIEKGWYGSGFYFDPVTNTFNIAQIRLIVIEDGETRAQVNIFSTATNSWTEKNVPVPCRIKRTRSDCYCQISGVSCVNGYMHWVVEIIQFSKSTSAEGEICLRFDKEDSYILSYNFQVFKRIEMPSSLSANLYNLTAHKGSLAVFGHERTGSHNWFDEVHVWVLNDCGGADHSWTKLLTCKPSFKIILAVGFFRKDDVDLILLDILLDKATYASSYLYDPETEQTRKFWKKNIGRHTFLYSETLASLN